jgi:hypothetical protein
MIPRRGDLLLVPRSAVPASSGIARRHAPKVLASVGFPCLHPCAVPRMHREFLSFLAVHAPLRDHAKPNRRAEIF